MTNRFFALASAMAMLSTAAIAQNNQPQGSRIDPVNQPTLSSGGNNTPITQTTTSVYDSPNAGLEVGDGNNGKNPTLAQQRDARSNLKSARKSNRIAVRQARNSRKVSSKQDKGVLRRRDYNYETLNSDN
jgi:hypothetical protein